MDKPHKKSPRHRILIIDDTESIHRDFDKILGPRQRSEAATALEELDVLLFGESEGTSLSSPQPKFRFDLEHALQGEEGYRKVTQAKEAGNPFHVAFVDMHMPPGWDGLKTIEMIWQADPDLQIVICSAYSDYAWNDIFNRLGNTAQLLILKKPFDQVEVFQLANALSQKWQAEQSTRELLFELEQKVERRTNQLQSANANLLTLNEELKRTANEAEAAARSKGRFLATMSHEIRTTLNGILGAAHMLDSTKLDASGKEFSEIIQSSGEALMIIINDILDYSKYETGQIDLESIPFAPQSLLQECANLLETVVRKNFVSFQLELDPSIPPSLKGDPARLRQILLNLLNNALKFARNGKVTLRATLVASDSETAKIRFEIEDDGIGMKEDTVKRLFSAFMQADSSTTREYGGTGLGLAICKLLSDSMKGKIDVQSAYGRGSTFTFTVSLAISDTLAERKTDLLSGKADKELALPDLSGRRVLLVDDNLVNGKLGRHFLKSFNIETTLAASGPLGIEAFKEEQFDLVLMDLQMPVMDGLEATQIIRRYEAQQVQHPPVPIVALTANAFSEIRTECIEAGMDDYLSKPLRIQELSAVLTKWLAPSARGRS